MRFHPAESGLFITNPTGNHNHAPVHPHPHISSWNKIRVAMVAEPSAELPVYPDTLAHRNPACEINVPVAPFRIFTERNFRLLKQDFNTLPRDPFSSGVTGLFLH